ncbi:NUDIX hydrolase [Candidatus Dojkabacteria bacterium]|nr:NUDIX hydrolase [Candidatus Dojkabacteria bacterium]
MHKNWKTLSSDVKYKNPWIEVVEDRVVMPNGKEGIYGYLKKSPGVFVVAKDTDGGIYLVKQYRYVLKKEIYELPAGTMTENDDILKVAKKELLEETGITAQNFQNIGYYYAATGHETTKAYTVIATDLDNTKTTTKNQEGDELINLVKKVSPKELHQMIKNNEITCGLTLAALNQYFSYKS